MATVCDFYTANANRWGLWDSLRAVQTTWLTDWVDAAILGGIPAGIGFLVWREDRSWRKRRERNEASHSE